jgi:hypothetical protein
VTPAGITVTRDARGQIIATSTTFKSENQSSTTHRDSSGRIIGNTHKLPSGNEVTRDDRGRIRSTASTNPAGDTVTYRDGNGSIIGTKYTSPAGNVTYRKANGEITGPGFR